MKGILIHPSDISPNTWYMHDNHGRYDLLGQIIYNMGYNIPLKTRTPQELNKLIVPFTISFRQNIFNSCITLEILRNSNQKVLHQIEAANKLLVPHGIELYTERQLEKRLRDAEET